MRDPDGAPWPGLVVEARQSRPLGASVVLASGVTDAEGRYRLAFAPTLAGALLRPDLRAAIMDKRGVRTLAQVPARDGAPSEIVLPRGEVEGWSATLGTGEPSRVSTGNDARLLVDAPEAFGPMLDAIAQARSRVLLMQFLLRDDFTPATGEGTLLEALRAAAARGVNVRVLLNANVFGLDDVKRTRAALDGASNVQVAGLTMQPGVQHAKALIVDDAHAFLVGMPFQQRFWDTRQHAVLDARRGKPQPNHDTALELRGPIVREIGSLLARLWSLEADPLPPPPREQPRAGNATMQVTRTLPSGILGEARERGCLEAHLRALSQAKHFLYHENQYFTSRAITKAVARALDAAPGLDIILLLNEATDAPTYTATQRSRLASLGEKPNLGLFTAWSVGELNGKRGLAPVYVHSKVAIADDAWAMTGSANLDGFGLEGAAEIGLRRALSIELNVSVLDGADGHAPCGLAARMRQDLWAEQLGLPARELATPPPGGWLALWRRVAQENLARVQAGDLRLQGHVLPLGAKIPRALRLPIRP